METRPVLYRPKDGAVVAGVCSGLARRWGVDPVVLRIAVAVLSFAGGLGIVAYAAAVLLIPREGSRELPIRGWLPFTRRWPTPAVIAAVVAAGTLLVAALGGWSSGMGPLLVIGLVWYFGIHRPRTKAAHTSVSATGEPTPFERAAEAWRHRLIQHRTQQGLPGTPGSPTSEHPASFGTPTARAMTGIAKDVTLARSAPRRGRSWAMACALMGAGALALWLLQRAGMPVPSLAYAAVVLGGLGLALVGSVRRGRPRLMIPAAVLAGAVCVALMAPSPPPLRVGEVAVRYTTAAELPEHLSVGMGEVTLDLRDLVLAADAATEVGVGAGGATILLPTSLTTEIDWSVKAGEYRSPEVTRAGLDLAGVERWTGDRVGSGTLRLRITVEAGSVEVVR